MELNQDFKEFIELLSKNNVEEDVIIQLGYEPNRIDILTSVTGLNFKECFNQKVVAQFDDLTVNFIDIRNLKVNKAATGRAKDLGDLENL